VAKSSLAKLFDIFHLPLGIEYIATHLWYVVYIFKISYFYSPDRRRCNLLFGDVAKNLPENGHLAAILTI